MVYPHFAKKISFAGVKCHFYVMYCWCIATIVNFRSLERASLNCLAIASIVVEMEAIKKFKKPQFLTLFLHFWPTITTPCIISEQNKNQKCKSWLEAESSLQIHFTIHPQLSVVYPANAIFWINLALNSLPDLDDGPNFTKAIIQLKKRSCISFS